IKAVTGDGAKWIDASVKERPPNAERVPDSFHIVSRMSDAPDQVGKRLRNQARRGNDKTATEAMRGVFTERQDTDPRGQPYRSWQLKKLPGTLPHQPLGQAGAELKRWIFRASHSRIPEIVELCRKIRRRKDDIPKTIRPGHSNARLEAFNNKIKVTIRMAYGFRHVDDLIAMIKLRCSGLPIHLPTPIL
ncbi:transposase, partial [Bifidobacterium bifidum]|uniref:transposase n=1 Tax=Bifidobacterium bifidum TaxID=1681 RepID=UPI0022E1EEF7